MKDHDVDRLEGQVNELRQNLSNLSGDDWVELIRIWRQPGWTTPAEFTLVSGVVESMRLQTQTLTQLKQVLFDGSREVRVEG